MSTFLGVITRILVISMLVLSLPSHASIMGAESTLPSVHQENRTKVMQFLAREDVMKAIQAQGVDVALVRSRVAAMNDQEIDQLSGKIDKMPAAGGGEILGVVVFVFVVLLITDILGLTKVFPFTRSIR